MIRPTKFSFLLILLFSTISFAQKLSSFEINNNFDFDDEQYLQWSGLSIGQPYFKGIEDSVKSRIANNLLKQGYFFFRFDNFSVQFSQDSSKYNIALTVEENLPVIVKNIFWENKDSTSNNDLVYRFDFLKDQTLNKDELENNIDDLLDYYENSGHPFAKIIISSVNVYQDTINNNYADIAYSSIYER